jgi:hypothetical protein
MTDQEINEAIALHLGWLRPEHPDCMKHKIGWSMPEKWWMDPKTVLRFGHDIPNYCADLNAMHEAEKTVSGEQTLTYCMMLSSYLYGCVHATARQRAEAFLRTIGKWKEAE